MGGAVLFVTWSGGGNVNPVLALSQRLVRRGHTVRVLGSADLVPRFAAIGVECLPRDPAREWDQGATAEDVVAEIGRVATDAVVVDYMQPGALCGAEAAGVPTAALVHTLYAGMRVDGDFPTMYMAANVEGINDGRDQLGLAPVTRLGDLLDHSARVLVSSPKRLDAGSGALPDNVRYVGPLYEERPASAPVVDDQPDIVVSLGTTEMGEGPLLQRVLDACGPLPVKVLATVGDHLDPASFTAPANARVARYVPHASVLPGARLLIGHAGLGGVLAALGAGVAVLCLPLGRDQPANAAAVERVGAGRALAPDASTDELQKAITELLDAPVTDLRPDIAAYGDAGVEEVESMFVGKG
jgi:UDP:flavonoid glycosyltransferase YjiC (YdhE family)